MEEDVADELDLVMAWPPMMPATTPNTMEMTIQVVVLTFFLSFVAIANPFLKLAFIPSRPEALRFRID